VDISGKKLKRKDCGMKEKIRDFPSTDLPETEPTLDVQQYVY
jgi:hypothetical protein